MKKPRSFELGLWECQGIRSQEDVAALVDLSARRGLVAGAGAWTREGGTPSPVADIEGAVAAARWLTPAGERAAAGGRVGVDQSLEMWRFPVLRPEFPRVFSNLSFGRRPGDRWDIYLLVVTSSHPDAGLSLEEFCAAWGPFLETLGDVLYERARPTLGAVTNSGDESISFEAAVASRRLVVGWRTWYGPGYVEAFGRDFLAELPDRSQPLPDSGVRHALDAPPLALAMADRTIYSRVLPFVEDAGVPLAWPRLKAAGRGQKHDRAAAQELVNPKTRGARRAPADGGILAAAAEAAAAVGNLDGDAVEDQDGLVRLTAFRSPAGTHRDAEEDRRLIEFQRTVAEELAILPALPDLDGSCLVQLVPFEWGGFTEAEREAAWALIGRSIGDVLARHPGQRLRVEVCDPHPDLARRLDQLTRELTRVSYVLLDQGAG